MNTINIYETRAMLAAVEKFFPVRTFLRDTFFPRVETFAAEKVLMDYRKGKRSMAPFVAPRIGGITVDRQGFETKEYSAPRIAPQHVLTLDDISTRAFGENVFSTRTPEQRQAEKIARDLMELDDSIYRREEWMASQLLFNGKVIMKGFTDNSMSTYIEQELDYNFTNKVILTGEALWSTTTADKYEQLEDWRLQILEATGRSPKMVLFGKDAWKAFRSDTKIMEMLDKRNILLGNINPIIKNDAVTYLGRLPELDLDLYTYHEFFIDDTGTTQPFVPHDHILMGSPDLGKFAYGAVTQMEKGIFITYEGKRIPKVWADDQNETRMMRLSSRPAVIPDDVDEWLVAKVL